MILPLKDSQDELGVDNRTAAVTAALEQRIIRLD